MGAAIDGTPGLDAMTDHGALAVSTTRCHRMNGTFEAVECHRLSSLHDLERLVVIVTAHIANRHEKTPCFESNATRELLVPSNACRS
jgi:hypothetical protein